MNDQLSFKFDYETPMRSYTKRDPMWQKYPLQYYVAPKGGGKLVIHDVWFKDHMLSKDKIALQIKGTNNSFIIFNPPDDAPCFYPQASRLKSDGACSFSCASVVHKLMDAFKLVSRSGRLTLKFVGEFGDSKVYKILVPNQPEEDEA